MLYISIYTPIKSNLRVGEYINIQLTDFYTSHSFRIRIIHIPQHFKFILMLQFSVYYCMIPSFAPA